MASISVSGASLVSTHPTTRMLKHHPILNIPFANPSLFSRKIDWSTCRSSSYKTRVASMSTTTSPSPVGGKGDRKLINVRPNEDVVKVSPWVEYLPQEIQPYAKLARVEKPIGVLLVPLMISLIVTLKNWWSVQNRDRWQAALSHRLQLDVRGFIPLPHLYLSSHEENDILGLTIKWGAIVGWHAVKGNLQPSIVFPLFLSGFFWTIIYDTIYVHQDKEDDVKIDIKSTALKFGESTKEWITGFAIACIASFALTGYNAALGWPFYAFLAAASAQLAWQIGTANHSSPADCNRKH
ncbi:4-hydroxybenzoate polyprenyltransferase [Hibiscus syriacus]|uniref:4-hydroxybenzoate polyprenyltransferase n=1 Tax=Hibiscus syriacus TaxID=106335 RepID=A0A6A3CJB6_HIBSY|nr:4-hydroxybenzoate polyprenyltransferase [Hibiscus syriacus]